jgi:aminoglycoside phosphotransferase family enzyme/predicted kinase
MSAKSKAFVLEEDRLNLASLIHELGDPQAFPAPGGEVEVHQTHISVVFLIGQFAYKIKKPVDFGFVDYCTLEKRRHCCEEEVRLNRRLAPLVYLGVVPIAQEGERIRVEGTGPVIEWAVKMRRLPEAATLRSAVQAGRAERATIEEIARRIADFHRRADRDCQIAEYGRFEVVAQNARENFEQSAPHVGTAVSARAFERLRAVTEESLTNLRGIIDDRGARRVTCDTHGDLRLEHVYLFPEQAPPGDLVIIDCIEFNPRFRAADPVSDMAFLMMDLIRYGRRDLARWFRDAYFAASDDAEGRTLVPFYVAYRAAVRGKVGGMKASEAEVGEPQRLQAQATAQAHWLLALGQLEDRRSRPCLILIGGLPGTGKSTLAKALETLAGFSVIRTDLVRRELAEAAGRKRQAGNYGAGIYSEEFTEETYRECVRRAEAGLFEGQRIVIDATFRTEAWRSRFLGLALRWGVPGLFLVCQADPALIKRRLDHRQNDASEADWAIYVETARRWEPLAPETERHAREIDTGRDWPKPLNQALEALRGLELWD